MSQPPPDSGQDADGDRQLPGDRASRWNARYEAGTTGWDLGAPAPPLAAWLSDRGVVPGARVLVPGCGRGHDARGWAAAGGQVTGVDFAPRALRAAAELAADAGLEIEWVGADVTALPASWTGRFDVIWEHTCLCALPPDLRAPYVDELGRVLAPSGQVHALLWAHGREGGPPWTMDESVVRPLVERRFASVERDAVSNSAGDRTPEFWWTLGEPKSR
jgi:SAM-dependent methyltransferase